MYLRDTIAAIATPAGPGGIGVVRASGPDCARLAASVVRRQRPGAWQSHRLYRGQVLAGDDTVLDDALAVLMRAPHSLTGEDVLELHCHGSPLILRLALQSLLRRGARAAEPGEFTKRAFLNGRIDLTQAEAVLELVGARTADAAGQAAELLDGALSRHLAGVRERLIRAKGLLEVAIDFSDEDVGLDPRAIAAAIDAARDATRAVLATYARGVLLRHGLRVALVGAPNVGKSSLLNALLGSERAIVTAQPGTTRDVIEESIDCDGIPVALADTAGLRDTADEVERLGVERARARADTADLVLLVLDGSSPPTTVPSWLDGERYLAVLNKADLPCAWNAAALAALASQAPVVHVSALRGEGLDDLRRAIVRRTGARPSEGVPTLSNARQHAGLVKVDTSLRQAADAIRDQVPPDLVAVDVQAALDHLGEVTGAITNDDVLDAVFREFCLGK